MTLMNDKNNNSNSNKTNNNEKNENTCCWSHLRAATWVAYTNVRGKERKSKWGGGKCVENVEKVSPLPQVEMFGIYQRRLQFFASFSSVFPLWCCFISWMKLSTCAFCLFINRLAGCFRHDSRTQFILYLSVSLSLSLITLFQWQAALSVGWLGLMAHEIAINMAQSANSCGLQ